MKIRTKLSHVFHLEIFGAFGFTQLVPAPVLEMMRLLLLCVAAGYVAAVPKLPSLKEDLTCLTPEDEWLDQLVLIDLVVFFGNEMNKLKCIYVGGGRAAP